MHRALACGRVIPHSVAMVHREHMDRSRRHSRTPIGRPQAMGAGPSDLYDSLRRAEPSRKRRRTQAPIISTDDWSEPLPITESEVRIVEACFDNVFDALFGQLP